MFKIGDKVRSKVDSKYKGHRYSGTVEEVHNHGNTADVYIVLTEYGSNVFNALDFELVSSEGVPAPAVKTASKNDSGKIDLSLIPYVAEKAEALAFMVGERKYGRYNYTKGHKASQLVAAAKRHLNAWFEGEELDPQDGQPHLGSVRACIAMLLRQQELGTLKDDRFKLPQGTEV